MNLDSESFAEQIAEAARLIPPAELFRWADKIASSSPSSSVAIDLSQVPIPLRRIIGECDRDGSIEFRQGVVLALRATGATSSYWQSHQAAELAWTGPDSGVIGIHRTEQVLYDLVSAATRSLIIVSFAAHRVPRLLEEIQRAADRNVSIRLILEFEESSVGQLSHDAIAAFEGLDSRVEVFWWPLSKRELNSAGRPGKLHVKCMVADGAKAFVSSANLTDDAMNRNMELGVVVTGIEASNLQKHFGALIENGVLERYKPKGQNYMRP